MEIIAQQICIILLKKKYSEDFDSIPELNEKLAKAANASSDILQSYRASTDLESLKSNQCEKEKNQQTIGENESFPDIFQDPEVSNGNHLKALHPTQNFDEGLSDEYWEKFVCLENDSKIENNSETYNLSQNSSIISHLISQVRIGMDLSKITLPTFILERKSFLECLAEMVSCLDLLTLSALTDNTNKRLIYLSKYFINGLILNRKDMHPKKPYNPVLGELFIATFKVPKSNFTGKNENSSNSEYFEYEFVAEQVSHHPPISALHLKCDELGVVLQTTIYTKSKFLGFSIGCDFVGTVDITFSKTAPDHFKMTLPSTYCRSILTKPWLEFGGRLTVQSLGFKHHRAIIEFKTKPILSNTVHFVTGNFYDSNAKQLTPFASVKGFLDSKIEYTKNTETPEMTFYRKDCIKGYQANVNPLKEQLFNESRRLWRNVSYFLGKNCLEEATEAKSVLEQKQRLMIEKLKTSRQEWSNICFLKVEAFKWIFEGLSKLKLDYFHKLYNE